MNAIELLTRNLNQSAEMLKMTLADFTDEELLTRPVTGANHPLWQVGHLCSAETFLINSDAIVSSLINDLADVDDEVCLFLEDYHWVTNPGIHDAVAFFLTHAPSQIHVVLTTRTEPPLPLASLRANNLLLEIDASALRFDPQETRAFLDCEKPGSERLGVKP